MAVLTPEQLRNRERAESVIGALAPCLDLVLALGDRISKMAEPSDPDYYPADPPTGEIPAQTVRED